jgi:hypothetical protein
VELKRKVVKLKHKWKSENIEEMEHEQELIVLKRTTLKVRIWADGFRIGCRTRAR